MANINAPQGFEILTPNAVTNAYTIATGYSTAINIGDPVVVTGTGVGVYAGIAIGVASSAITGVFAGCDYTDSNNQPQWGKSWPASTTATNIVAYVYDNPLYEYRVQITTVAVTDYFDKVGFASGAGTLGISGYYLDGATIGTGTDFQIRGVYNQPGDNTVGAYAQVRGVFRLSTNNYPYTAV
jgi:hypothetical protein